MRSLAATLGLLRVEDAARGGDNLSARFMALHQANDRDDTSFSQTRLVERYKERDGAMVFGSDVEKDEASKIGKDSRRTSRAKKEMAGKERIVSMENGKVRTIGTRKSRNGTRPRRSQTKRRERSLSGRGRDEKNRRVQRWTIQSTGCALAWCLCNLQRRQEFHPLAPGKWCAIEKLPAASMTVTVDRFAVHEMEEHKNLVPIRSMGELLTYFNRFPLLPESC